MTDSYDTEGKLFSVGGQVERVTVSLRIFGDELDPDEISVLLNCEPTSKARKGDVVAAAEGRQRVSPFGSWLLKSVEPEDVDLEEQVLKLLARVSADRSVWQRLTQQYKVDLFCGLFMDMRSWNRGFLLTPKVLRELSERNLEIDFDIYAV
ncbi:MAG TPA: DUF4279 domain-containing protein [Pyrinomonadaceae bacterium]|jgi:hypothetical protein|nr:DUF4279 domain-containing protein [Pyrinomonadaceae bacterium]